MNSIWIARDEDGDLYAYKSKPFKCGDTWASKIGDFISTFAYKLNSDWFPELTRENSPIELVIKEN